MSGLLLIPAIVVGVVLLLVFISGFLRYIPNNSGWDCREARERSWVGKIGIYRA
jgi:hypothetical protein